MAQINGPDNDGLGGRPDKKGFDWTVRKVAERLGVGPPAGPNPTKKLPEVQGPVDVVGKLPVPMPIEKTPQVVNPPMWEADP